MSDDKLDPWSDDVVRRTIARVLLQLARDIRRGDRYIWEVQYQQGPPALTFPRRGRIQFERGRILILLEPATLQTQETKHGYRVDVVLNDEWIDGRKAQDAQPG